MSRRKRKVNLVVSRLKALLNIIENFNRSDTSSLNYAGTTSAQWTSIRGSWGISTNKGSSSTSASNYPISVLTFSSEYVTLGVDGISPGVGTAFWVTDSGNWWGTYVDGTQTCQTCQNASTCASYSTCTNPSSGGNCSSYGTCYNASNCSGYGTCYNPSNCASYTTCYNPSNCASYANAVNPSTGGNCASYSTCYNPASGGNCSGYGTCQNAPSGGNCIYTYGCCAYNPYTPGNTTTAYTNVLRGDGSCATQGLTAAGGSSCSGYFSQFYCCSYTTTNPGSGGNCSYFGYCCTGYNPSTPGNNYACCINYNPYVPGNSYACCASTNPIVPGNPYTYCATANPSNPYSCCGSYNPSNPYTCCTSSNPSNPYTCCTGYNPYVAGNNYTCCSSYNNPTNYPCNCNTDNSIKLIKSVSGVVSTVATFAFNTAIAGFKTILSNGNVTVRAYSGSGYTSQIGSDQSSSTGAFTSSKQHGIIKAPTTYTPAQTGDIDEFRVE